MRRVRSLYGSRLRGLRERQGLTLADVGAYVGVTDSAVSKWEFGHTDPTISNLVDLCVYLGTTADYLLGLADQ